MNTEGKVRREGPDTSRAAAKQANIRKGQMLVIKLLLNAEGEGIYRLIDEQIEEILDKKHDPRRLECCEQGWVEWSGHKEKTSRGIGAKAWCLTEAGRELGRTL